MDHMMANDIGIMSEKEWAEKHSTDAYYRNQYHQLKIQLP